MTCFWDGILRALDPDDFLFARRKRTKPNKTEFIHWLKCANSPLHDVHWNNKILTPQEQTEHKEAIGHYKVSDIHAGHMCSSCDSFLLLIAQLFQVTIQHSYMNNLITYTNIKNSRKTLRFVSNSTHFQCIRRRR